MATLVLIQKRKACARRQELHEQRQNHQRFVRDVLSSWDKGGSGDLKFDEVKTWLSSISQGNPPSEDEVKWVIVMANQQRTNDYTNAAIKPEDFSRAIDAFLSYRECKDEIEGIFQKYDVDKSGSLDKGQLTNLLTELNEGAEPTGEEVDWVIKHADVIGNGAISKPELAKAISVWYVHVAEIERNNSMAEAAMKPSGICSSGACVVQ